MSTEIKTAVGQARGWVDGQILPAVFDKIAKLFPAETKKRAAISPDEDPSEYTLQNGELEIDGMSIRLSIFDNDMSLEAKGKPVTITSTKGRKGLAGVKYEIKNYKSKTRGDVTEECLTISVSAKIQVGTGEDFQQELDNQPKAKQLQEPKSSASQETAQDVIKRILTLHYICHKEVISLYKEELPETRQAYTASLFIEANRQGASNLLLTPIKPPSEEQDVLDAIEAGYGDKDWN